MSRVEPPWSLSRRELLLDRLRIRQVGDDVLAEAEARLRADGEAGWRWLLHRLGELYPAPDDLPSCGYCSTPLVESGWTGEAVIVCPGCGAGWQVEVHSAGSWNLSGRGDPSPEWLAAHPTPVESGHDYPAEDVLDGELPELPRSIEIGDAYPLARWNDDRYGAVLYVTREQTRPGDLPGDGYGHEIEFCERGRDGSWTWAGRAAGAGGILSPCRPTCSTNTA